MVPSAPTPPDTKSVWTDRCASITSATRGTPLIPAAGKQMSAGLFFARTAAHDHPLKRSSLVSYSARLSLDGRSAVVTGGTKGAGAAVVRRLKQAGAHVTAVAR